MTKILYEVKLYIFLIVISCLLLVIREQVSLSVLSTYFLTSIFGIKTVSCFITGRCFYEVYYFLIGYAILNIVFVFYYREMQRYFPKIFTNGSKKNQKKRNLDFYTNLKNNLLLVNDNFKKKFNRNNSKMK